MKGLFYQLKNIRRDKMCILSFFLPVVMGLAITFMSDISFSEISETSFGVIQNNISTEATHWLQDNGSIIEFHNEIELHNAILEPKSQMIGVLWNGETIETILAGDEFQMTTTIANTLPQLFENRNAINHSNITIFETEKNDAGIKTLLLVVTLITAMFMGCTFNAMNIIGEKEDGISLINEIMPLSKTDYLVQKILLGFVGGTVSTLLTIIVCVNINISQILPLLTLVLLSAFIAALAGLFVGKISSGLMVGIVYLKVVMILFIAPPIFFSLLASPNSIVHVFSYLIPSSATFYGLSDVLNGKPQDMLNIFILILHCVVWTALYVCIENHKMKKQQYL